MLTFNKERAVALMMMMMVVVDVETKLLGMQGIATLCENVKSEV